MSIGRIRLMSRRQTRQAADFGLLCDRKGRPLSVTVCRGNLRDSQTLLPQVKKLKKRFGIDRLVVAGDRGMITQVNIDALGKLDGVDWITALKSITIKLVKKGALTVLTKSICKVLSRLPWTKTGGVSQSATGAKTRTQ